MGSFLRVIAMTASRMPPDHISVEQAFELSGYANESEFMIKLNELLRAGLPSISRLNIPGANQFEPTPPLAWLNGTLWLSGHIIIQEEERLREEHKHTEVGVITITHNSVWPVPRYDVRFLRADFIKAWNLIPAKPQPESEASPLFQEHVAAPKRGRPNDAVETARKLLKALFPPSGILPESTTSTEIWRTVIASDGYKNLKDKHLRPQKDSVLRAAERRK